MAPAIAHVKDVLPVPGGPYSKYPLLYGTPLSRYHLPFDLNFLISAMIFSASP